MQQLNRVFGVLAACTALLACGKAATPSDTSGSGPTPPAPTPATTPATTPPAPATTPPATTPREPVAKADPLDGVRWGVAQELRVVMVITLDSEDALVGALDNGKASDGRRLDELSGETDQAKRVALFTPPLAKVLGADSPFALGKRWQVISASGTDARDVSGLEVVQDGHYHYLLVHFAGLGKDVPAMTFRRPPTTVFELGFEKGFALFVPGAAPVDLRVIAPTIAPPPSAEKLASLRDALLGVTDADMKAVLSAATLSADNARLIEGRFPKAAALFEVNLTRAVPAGEEAIFHCDNDVSIITFVNPTRATLMSVDAASPALGWASAGALGTNGFAGCGQVLGRVPLGDGFDAIVVEYPFTVGNDVVIYRWDGQRYVGTDLYMQGSG